ncbi:MAG: AbrB/MazE/SpoVT family DNA-binding domain-containing protein [Candidatus Woesearchaeota archaeon]
MEITSLSSRGQVVIPQQIRELLHLTEGEKFLVFGEKDTIILKKIETPSFEKLLKETRGLVKEKGIKQVDVDQAISRSR